MRRARGVLSVLLVVLAAGGAAFGALELYTVERRLAVAEVHVSSDLFHRGSLDLYVPLVDWGVRFGGVRLPARLQIDVRSVDRTAALRLAQAGTVDVDEVRAEARDAIEAYIRRVVFVVLFSALAMGVLVAFALRGPLFPWTLAAAGATAVIAAVAVIVLLPPRGDLGDPEYFAHGPDIPRALGALRTAASSVDTLRDELDNQLVGIARLVTAPAARADRDDLPRATIASDLHNNIVALPTLEQSARGGPLLFVGDLTDRGTPLETSLSTRIARAGAPFVLTPGNHDSDVLLSRLSRAGAVVLRTDGRQLSTGERGPVVVRIGGMRVAGYDDPNMRTRRDGYADHGASITDAQRRDFAAWLAPLVDRVDVVMVHNPALLDDALEALRADPPDHPLVFAVGHTHLQKLDQPLPGVTVVNGGTIGAGGTGNLAEAEQPVGLAQLTYRTSPFAPVTADLVEIDSASGAARAERRTLEPAAAR